MNFDIVLVDPISNWNDIHMLINNKGNNDGRITKITRERLKKATDEGKNVIALAALQDGVMVGVSCAVISRKMVHTSFTIVRADKRKQKIGRSLLAAKIMTMYSLNPDVPITCYVGQENAAGIKICQLNNLGEVGTRNFKLKSGKEITSRVFSNATIA